MCSRGHSAGRQLSRTDPRQTGHGLRQHGIGVGGGMQAKAPLSGGWLGHITALHWKRGFESASYSSSPAPHRAISCGPRKQNEAAEEAGEIQGPVSALNRGGEDASSSHGADC